MSLINSIKNSFVNIKSSFKRFPITLSLSSILFVLLIVLNEIQDTLNTSQIEELIKANMVIGLGVFLSLCIGLLLENINTKFYVKIVSYGSGILLLLFYYFFIIDDFRFVSISRYIALLIFLIISFFYLPRLKKNYFEMYVIKIFSSLFLTFVYSLVLFLGIVAIIFTLNSLFDLNIDSKYYYYTFLFIGTIFAVALFLSKIPTKYENLELFPYAKSLKVLLNYIVIPLLIIYTLILYVYFGKIILTWEWPSGLVSHLVLWYSCISVAVIFLITPLKTENTLSKLFSLVFPKIILPLLLMMFVSMGLRIQQYGITENRYFVLLLGFWLLVTMLYFSIVKKSKNIFIPITLSLIVLIAVIGPISSYSVSKISQNNRFVDILERNNMLSNNTITSNSNISQYDKKEINNILTYFYNKYQLSDIKTLPENFTLKDTKNTFGFDYSQDYGYENIPYVSYFLDISNQPLIISGYDYYFQINSWNIQVMEIDGLQVKFESQKNVITVYENNQILFTKDISSYIEKIHDDHKDKGDSKSAIENAESVTFVESNEDLNIKFILTNIYGSINNQNTIDLEGVEFYTLIKIK